jgi:hypothetical protein
MNARNHALASLATLLVGCVPCPPGGGGCAHIYVVSAASSQPVEGATVTVSAPNGGNFTPTRSCSGQQDGCYVTLGSAVACYGQFRVRVDHPSYLPFEQTFTAPVGRDYECAQRAHRVDVRLTPR